MMTIEEIISHIEELRSQDKRMSDNQIDYAVNLLFSPGLLAILRQAKADRVVVEKMERLHDQYKHDADFGEHDFTMAALASLSKGASSNAE